MVNSEELIGTTEYPTLCTRFRINRCRYNRVRLYIVTCNQLPIYLHSNNLKNKSGIKITNKSTQRYVASGIWSPVVSGKPAVSTSK